MKSPSRLHDTGMVALISQDLSEFALHIRAIPGLLIPEVQQFGPTASHVILVEGKSTSIALNGVSDALSEPGTALRLFGKPEVAGKRCMSVGLALDSSIEAAGEKAMGVAESIKVEL